MVEKETLNNIIEAKESSSIKCNSQKHDSEA